MVETDCAVGELVLVNYFLKQLDSNLIAAEFLSEKRSASNSKRAAATTSATL